VITISYLLYGVSTKKYKKVSLLIEFFVRLLL